MKILFGNAVLDNLVSYEASWREKKVKVLFQVLVTVE